MKPDDPRSWEPIGPSALAFGANLPRVPHAMTKDEILRVRGDFAAAAKRALAVGFEWLEVHFAHGYLGQSFFRPSPTSGRTNMAAVSKTASGS